jgi:dihydrofolate reductase
MGRVFVDVGMLLDGFIAGPNAGPRNPLGDGGIRIHEWVYPLAAFRSRLGMEGGESGRDNDRVEAIFARTGAYVMGRRMFDEGEVGWPEDPPFHAPVFVLTHRPREPWVRAGGTTFTFDELAIHLAPVLLGRGVPLFGNVSPERLALAIADVETSALVTHLTYRVADRPS